MYIALIGDIIGSRKISDRKMVQDVLKILLGRINREYQNSIASDFMITLGDEFQGLLRNPYSLVDIIEDLKRAMHPVRIRFAAGIGEVSTGLQAAASMMDGPAFHTARQAIDDIKKSEKSYQSRAVRTVIATGGRLPGFDERLANALLSACARIESRWTRSQREKIYALSSGITQREAAKILGISQPSVQKALEQSGYYTYREAMEDLNRSLSDAWRKEYDH